MDVAKLDIDLSLSSLSIYELKKKDWHDALIREMVPKSVHLIPPISFCNF
jgi:hypothetical protein